jgi:hypothetical protein
MKSLAYIPGSNGTANASLMTVQTLRAPLATTIVVNTVLGAPTKFYGSMGTPHTFTDPQTSETITVISEATAVDFAGSISGGQVNIDAIAPGYTDLGSKVGDIIVIRPGTEWANNIFNTLSQSHNDDGSIKNTAIPNVSDHVQSGGIWTALTGLNAAMTALFGYQATNGNNISAISTRAFTASKDTYVDVLRNTTTNAFTLVYTEVANGATAGFILAANSMRLAKVVTSGTAITSILQNAFDSLGNPIRSTYPISQTKIINPYKFRVYRTAAFSLTAATETVIPFDTKSFDSSNNVDIVTNKGRFTALVAGFYHFDANVSLNPASTALVYMGLKVNGVFAQRGNDIRVATVNKGVLTSAFLQLAAGDYVEVFCYSDVVSGLDVAGATSNTTFSGFLVSQM